MSKKVLQSLVSQIDRAAKLRKGSEIVFSRQLAVGRPESASFITNFISKFETENCRLRTILIPVLVTPIEHPCDAPFIFCAAIELQHPPRNARLTKAF